MDIVNISPTIADIIKSVTNPGQALALVFYLFVISCMIFASFGFAYMDTQLLVVVDDDDPGYAYQR